MDRREQNIRVFFDTEDWYRSTEKLRRTIRKSIQGTKLYTENAFEMKEEERQERTRQKLSESDK